MVFLITVAFPLSAARMVRSVFFLNERSAVLSVLVRLSVGLLARLMILTYSCLASSAIYEGSDLMAFSTPVSRSSMGGLRGVTAKFKPFCSSEYTPHLESGY